MRWFRIYLAGRMHAASRIFPAHPGEPVVTLCNRHFGEQHVGGEGFAVDRVTCGRCRTVLENAVKAERRQEA